MKEERSESIADGTQQIDLATLLKAANMTLTSTAPERLPTLWIGSPLGSEPTPFGDSSEVDGTSQEPYEPCLKDVIVISFMLSLWLYSIWLMFR